MGWNREALVVGVPVRLNRFRGSIKLKSVVFFNCIYSKFSACKYENVIMELIKRNCLLFMLYATEAVTLSASSFQCLDNCINRVAQ